MILASLSEVISIGAVLPFIGALVDPETVFNHHLAQPLLHYLQINEPSQIVLPFTLLFVFLVIFSGAIRLLLLFIMTWFAFRAGHDLNIEIYRRTLYQDYITHISRNSSDVINGVILKSNKVIYGVITPILTLISSIIFVVAIVTTLFFIDIFSAITTFVGFGSLYWIVIKYTQRRLKENSYRINKESTKVIKSLQEGLGGIRDVIIDGSHQFYYNLFRDADLIQRKASGENIFITNSPRYVMEVIGICLIVGVAYALNFREDGIQEAFPVLAALALGAQKILPAMQQGYSSLSMIRGSHDPFSDVLELLHQPLLTSIEDSQSNLVVFEDNIRLENISFQYEDGAPLILDKINLLIPKGSCVGFFGKTGSGKSTLIDIIMGLLLPSGGRLLVDEVEIYKVNSRSWQNNIAHVPQDIFLADSSIEENIAFGVAKDKIDKKNVLKAAQQAHISDLIEQWPEKYQTFVGERGVRLSGGQKQRIGIARALYKKADLLVLDEATSALDHETENEVMEVINNLKGDLTILIIAHRLSTLTKCNYYVNVKDKNITLSNSHKDLIQSSLN